MAFEIRHIVFNDAELLRALSAFRIRTGKPMPPGTVKKLVVKKTDNVRAHLTLERLKNGSDIDFSFEVQEIAAALVMFCIHNNIPVPVAGFTKELDLTDGMVTLTVRSTLPTELVEEAARKN